MTSNVPEISVLLPTYNGARTIHRAITSILQQSLQEWELVIVDDGSTDDTLKIISSFRDDRIRTIQHEQNRGLVQALRTGSKFCSAPLIARQDQDDVSLRHRLFIQTNFLKLHPKIAIVGTWADVVNYSTKDEVRVVKRLRHPKHHGDIRWLALYNCPFVHSSIVMRRDVLESLGGYSDTSPLTPPEDYELWTRLLKKHIAANIPQSLINYQQSPSGMSSTLRPLIEKNSHQIALAGISELMQRPFTALDSLFVHSMNATISSRIKFIQSFEIDASMIKYFREMRKQQISSTYFMLIKSIIRNHLVFFRFLVLRTK